ncbi:MAG: GFA family protein [Hyphomicrobiales bacterium]
MTQLSGACLCGAVSYKGNADIKMTMNCHCVDCRKVTGSTYGTLLFVVEDSVDITGKTNVFHHKSDRGSDMQKLFCSSCGSQMFTRNSARQGVIGIRAGTVDQTDVVKPTANLFNDSAFPSTPMDDTIPLHDKMPT